MLFSVIVAMFRGLSWKSLHHHDGTMYDGEPIVRVELDTSVMLDVSVNGSCGDSVSADVTADAYIEDIKYCPFCGEEL